MTGHGFMHTLTLAILAAGLMSAAGAQELGPQGEASIRITGAAPPPVVAIAPIEVSPQTTAAFEAADEIRKVLRYDLDFTGAVLFPESETLVAEQHNKDKAAGLIDFSAWRGPLRSDYVIKGEYKETKPGEFELKLFLYNTATTAAAPALRYSGPRAQLRASVHLYSDQVIKQLTGKLGIAHTIIAFILDDGASRELYFMDYDGHNVRRKTRDNSIALYPSWSPDGKKLAYTSYRDGGTDLFILDIISGVVTRIGEAPGLNTQATWNPSGTEICLAMSQPGNVELFRMSATKRGAPPRRITFQRSIESSPSWSPDGSRILFTSDRAGLPAIYVMNADGGGERRLTTLSRHSDNARWSPDGTRIAFQNNSAGEFNIYVMNADGSNVERVTSGPGDKETPSWSPDGEHIAFSSTRRGTTEIYAVNLRSRNVTRISNVKGNALQPAWGP